MSQSNHPFFAVAALAKEHGPTGLKLKVERGGAYVRLVHTNPSIFFKYRPDPGDSLDRTDLDHFKRLTLSEDDCAEGPEATLNLIETLLEKFADYTSQRPSAKSRTRARE